MHLSDLGWRDTFEHAFAALDRPDLTPARVVRQDRQRYQLRTPDAVLDGLLLGALQHADALDRPAVGDWVAVQVFDDDQAIIHAVLPRFSAFVRKEAGERTRQQVLATNIDTAFLVSGLDHDFNLRRIERFLTQTIASGAQPVIVLNKADVCPDTAVRVEEVQHVAPGVPVHLLSAMHGSGLGALEPYLRSGQTVVFLGSSGVGKSTLVNALLGTAQQATRAVRDDDSRGRHTTSHRELFVLPGGSLLLDTPGLRELQLWADADDLAVVFEDIEALAAGCRFRDCVHETEPGCAVQAALNAGDLDPGRYASYQKLRREIAYLDQRQDEAAHLKAKAREKQFGKMIKTINRHNQKRQR